jgi:hypothetical protein
LTVIGPAPKFSKRTILTGPELFFEAILIFSHLLNGYPGRVIPRDLKAPKKEGALISPLDVLFFPLRVQLGGMGGAKSHPDQSTHTTISVHTALKTWAIQYTMAGLPPPTEIRSFRRVSRPMQTKQRAKNQFR